MQGILVVQEELLPMLVSGHQDHRPPVDDCNTAYSLKGRSLVLVSAKIKLMFVNAQFFFQAVIAFVKTVEDQL
jgi:hypothetical protein